MLRKNEEQHHAQRGEKHRVTEYVLKYRRESGRTSDHRHAAIRPTRPLPPKFGEPLRHYSPCKRMLCRFDAPSTHLKARSHFVVFNEMPFGKSTYFPERRRAKGGQHPVHNERPL